MPSTTAPRTLEIRTRILDVLREAHPHTVTTRAVQTALSGTVRAYPGVVYPQLLALSLLGQVERVPHLTNNCGAHWRYVIDDEGAPE